ncbi:MAG: DUF2330 domain-containing protein, partial [Planctomycetota bacterium]
MSAKEGGKSAAHLFLAGLFWCAIGFVVMPWPTTVYADGKFFAERAYKVPPAIPSQRAILIHKDGTEKLIIESALQGEGKEFGWVIPLPAKPTEFEKVSPGLIKTLSLTLQPRITHDLTNSLGSLYVISTIVALSCLLVLTIKPKEYTTVLLITGLGALSACLLVSALGTAKQTAGVGGADSAVVPGVKVQNVQEIGSYNLAVLEADSANALDEWLGKNGFSSLTEKDHIVVSDYIKRSWYFVAAKLRREGEGFSRPHPLAMSFVTEEPVYPIRLTGTAGSSVYIELFVIAEGQAETRQLPLEVSDEYVFREEARRDPVGKELLPGFLGNTYRQHIGHPSAMKLMWDGCVLNRLCGTLKPEEMTEDIIIRLKAGDPYQRRYFSRRGAKD